MILINIIQKKNGLIEKLDNEVIKIKEKLEFFLSDCNSYINFSEKINKIIKTLKRRKWKINYKKLLCVSKINDNCNKIRILNNELIKNINIKFIREEHNIKF